MSRPLALPGALLVAAGVFLIVWSLERFGLLTKQQPATAGGPKGGS